MDLVRIANKRFLDLPRSCCPQAAPFRSNANEVHPNMTGELRRAMTPLMWVVLLGLQPDSRPDDDVLLRAALLLNEVQIRLRSIKMDWECGERTREDIEKIQKIAHAAGVCLTEALSIRVNTKIH